MPTYCYTNSNGDTLEKFWPLTGVNRPEHLPEKIVVNGHEYCRDYHREAGGFIDTPGNWPQYSKAAGVHPSQIAEAVKKHPHHEYHPQTGEMVFRDRSHRRQVLRELGMVDRDGGYGDG